MFSSVIGLFCKRERFELKHSFPTVYLTSEHTTNEQQMHRNDALSCKAFPLQRRVLGGDVRGNGSSLLFSSDIAFAATEAVIEEHDCPRRLASELFAAQSGGQRSDKSAR
ncbi:hypothetical protein JOB18_020283 [Solea senegalensis]|uniref:Uncharacterized protein n=1 Tax=Solea senegalensis TaxID=28829 RepID=A0AAV6Q308_SOLSE|nr:hypothetical protein JOB18_020283 [Solea senegalensis]